MRRLPVYILLDCSESMAGVAIDTVNTAVQAMTKDLCKNPHALETVSLSVITFSRTAQQVVPLTELERFQMPELAIHPGTSLGAALELLLQCINREIVKTTVEKKGDWRPLVFLFTDGQPTDDWQKTVEKLGAMKSPKIANIYAIGCGDDVDYAVLHQITDIVFKTADMSPETIQKAFIWITASVQSASVGADGGVEALPVLDSQLEGALEKVAPGTYQHDPVPLQVFIHACCQQTKQHYLMRYSRLPEDTLYLAKEAHPLKSFEAGDAADLPPINSSKLLGVPPCPYCGNGSAAVCGCGGIFCLNSEKKDGLVCPHCGNVLQGAVTGGSFDVSRTAG
jgi:uncharacterized protein YegL